VTNDWRTVLDTGVVVSAVLLPRSVPRQAFDLAVSRGALLVSDQTIVELDEVLRRPKFDRYVSESQRLEFLAALLREAEVIEVHDVVTECRDPKDNKILELALSGQGSHIVTGDLDLLVLHPFRGIAIVNPQSFLAIAEEQGPRAEPSDKPDRNMPGGSGETK
jgi:putative PIN family toxin of toxin-antitoxin system